MPTNRQPANLERAALHSYLQRVPILASLGESDLRCLEDIEQVHCAPGEIVERQGDAARFFWILLEGSLRVSMTRSDGLDLAGPMLAAGTAFGELPLLASIQNPTTVQAVDPAILLRLTEDRFWRLMTTCPEVRKAILGNMAMRLQKMQASALQQEKMASLGTLAAGLMHELNNPGAAARRASTQLRENLLRLHELSARFTRTSLSEAQKQCLLDLQSRALAAPAAVHLNSLDQSDAEEALAEWMEASDIDNPWKLAPVLASIGLSAGELSCARASFTTGTTFSDALNWLEALISSMNLVGTIEESIGRVTTLVGAVKSYAYEGKPQCQATDINQSLHATLVILGHKLREKQIVLEKKLDPSLPALQAVCSGLNQIWTNLLDNAIDAAPEHSRIKLNTWSEPGGIAPSGSDPSARPESHAGSVPALCISVENDGPGIPLEIQPHIFDPFYTTKPVGVGTGLGLGIVHRIVEQMGGTIRFTSVPGSTVFHIRLPARQTTATSAS